MSSQREKTNDKSKCLGQSLCWYQVLKKVLRLVKHCWRHCFQPCNFPSDQAYSALPYKNICGMWNDFGWSSIFSEISLSIESRSYASDFVLMPSRHFQRIISFQMFLLAHVMNSYGALTSYDSLYKHQTCEQQSNKPNEAQTWSKRENDNFSCGNKASRIFLTLHNNESWRWRPLADGFSNWLKWSRLRCR